LIKEEWIHSLVKVVIEEPEVNILKRTKEKNKEVVRVVEEIKKISIKALSRDK